MNYLLAIDGGSTKTHVLCADESGRVIQEGSSGPTSLTTTSVGAASFSLKEGIRQATENLPTGFTISKLVMGLAGLDTPAEAATAKSVFQTVIAEYKVQNFELYNDSVIALAGATTDPNAIILISGTGSICYGYNEQGKTAKSGGLDFFLTDQGSGFSIGRHVLREAVKSADGRSAKTQLEQMVLDYFRITQMDELKAKVNNPLISKSEVSAIAELCFVAAEAGDLPATQILSYSADELVLMVEAVVKELGLENRLASLATSGRIMAKQPIYQPFSQQIMATYPELKLVLLEQPAVYGALKLALKV